MMKIITWCLELIELFCEYECSEKKIHKQPASPHNTLKWCLRRPQPSGVIYEDEIGKQHASRASYIIKSDEALSDVVAADAVERVHIVNVKEDFFIYTLIEMMYDDE